MLKLNLNPIQPGPFDDLFLGTAGNDSFSGGIGNDTMKGSKGSDHFDGGAGADTVDYSNSLAAVQIDLEDGRGFGGDAQGDTYSGVENVIGSAFDDEIMGSAADNVIDAGGGDDFISPGDGNNVVFAGDGDDFISLLRTRGSSNVDAGNGDDSILVLSLNNDVIDGGDGTDSLRILNTKYYNQGGGAPPQPAGVTIDLATGTADDGRGGTAKLFSIENVSGGNGDDTFIGNKANNIFGDAQGDDRMTGGAGEDIFVFRNGDGWQQTPGALNYDHGNDVITDFEVGADKIDLSLTEVKGYFDILDPSHGLAVQDGDDVIIYTTDQGAASDGANSITLENVKLGDLSDSDFIFGS